MTTFSATVLQQLSTIRANQTLIIMPELTTILAKIAGLDSKILALENKLADMDAKLDAIALQVSPAETGDFNPQTAKVS